MYVSWKAISKTINQGTMKGSADHVEALFKPWRRYFWWSDNTRLTGSRGQHSWPCAVSYSGSYMNWAHPSHWTRWDLSFWHLWEALSLFPGLMVKGCSSICSSRDGITPVEWRISSIEYYCPRLIKTSPFLGIKFSGNLMRKDCLFLKYISLISQRRCLQT